MTGTRPRGAPPGFGAGESSRGIAQFGGRLASKPSWHARADANFCIPLRADLVSCVCTLTRVVAAQLAGNLVSLCVCMSLQRAVVIWPAPTHAAPVSSPSPTALRLSILSHRQMRSTSRQTCKEGRVGSGTVGGRGGWVRVPWG